MSRRASVGGLLAGAFGLVLFFVTLRRTGVATIADGLARVGWGFLLVLVVSGYRFLARAMAWRLCVEPPHTLPLPAAFGAFLVGDALGNVTPLGLLASEPAKAALAAQRMPLVSALSSVALENLFYSLTVALVIASGSLVLIAEISGANAAVRLTASAGLAAMLVVALLIGGALFWRARFVTMPLDWLQRLGLMPSALELRRARFDRFEALVHSFAARHRARLAPIFALELTFHAAGVLEIAIILMLLGIPVTLFDAFILEAVNRLITVAFKFVPLRLGVDEAGTGVLTSLLGLGAATGVTMAVVRKVRVLAWAGCGVMLLARHGVTRVVMRGAPSPDSPLDPAPAECCIAVMARSPVAAPDHIKTRLTHAIPDAAQRIALYRAFVQDTLALVRSIEGATLRVFYAPEGGPDGFGPLGCAPDELHTQSGDDLGERERSVFERLFREGHRAVIVIGSDLPTLPAAHLVEAQRILAREHPPVVLGPSEDGGYYLIGLAASHGRDARVPELFDAVRWSTPHALDDTRERARALGLRVHLLPSWYDVDNEAGLERLRRDLLSVNAGCSADHTSKVLKDLELS